MELMEGVKGYSDSREEDDEKEEGAEEEIITSSSSKHNFPSFSLSSPSSSSIVTNYTRHHHNHHHHHVINNPHQQNPWLGMMHIHDHHHHHRSPEATESHNSSSELGLLHHHQDAAPSNFIINNSNHTTKQLDFMDLSLGSTNKDEPNFQGSGGASASAIYTHHHGNNVGSSSSGNSNHQQPQQVAEKEHMFDKVVTPSDVGKLNRLVIPKQYAEKYFPLDSTSNEKGLLLNFEDRNGKLWRFRYSYWNSSQSYVMTKGWSRFVKEKKLDAGDIVSFQRGVGELYRHRLYIDWRRRPDHHQHQYHHSDPSSTLFTPFFLPNHPQFLSIRWGATAAASGRFYPLPSPTPLTPPRHHHDINYNNSMYHQQHPFHHGNVTHHHHYNNNYNEMSSTSTTSGSGSVYYLRSTTQIPMPLVDHQSLSTRQQQQQEGGGGGNVSLSPMIIDSVPVAHHHHQQHHHNQQHHGGSSNSSSAGKRLRLFGVNMECASSTSEDPKCFDSNSLPSSSLPPLQLLREHTLPSPTSSTMFGDKRGEASMDPSNLQYRQ